LFRRYVAQSPELQLIGNHAGLEGMAAGVDALLKPAPGSADAQGPAVDCEDDNNGYQPSKRSFLQNGSPMAGTFSTF
jgi:hypothetical protein